jgi:hypothetical protein
MRSNLWARSVGVADDFCQVECREQLDDCSAYLWSDGFCEPKPTVKPLTGSASDSFPDGTKAAVEV